MSKLKLYTISFYEEPQIRSGFLHKDGGMTSDSDLTDEVIPYIQFFANKNKAKKVLKEYEKEYEDDYLVTLEEYEFNVK